MKLKTIKYMIIEPKEGMKFMVLYTTINNKNVRLKCVRIDEKISYLLENN